MRSTAPRGPPGSPGRRSRRASCRSDGSIFELGGHAPPQGLAVVDPVLLEDDARSGRRRCPRTCPSRLVRRDVTGEDRSPRAVHLALAAEHLAPLAQDDRLSRGSERDASMRSRRRQARRHSDVQRRGEPVLSDVEHAECALPQRQARPRASGLDAAVERTPDPDLLDRRGRLLPGAVLDPIFDAVGLGDVFTSRASALATTLDPSRTFSRFVHQLDTARSPNSSAMPTANTRRRPRALAALGAGDLVEVLSVCVPVLRVRGFERRRLGVAPPVMSE